MGVGFSDQTFVSGDEFAPFPLCQREIDAVIGGVVELDRKPCGGFEQGAHGHQLDLGVGEEPGRRMRLLFSEFSPPGFFPEHVGAFGKHKLRSDQWVVAQSSGCLGSVLLDEPFDNDAGINDVTRHRSSRPSRTSTSAGVW